MLILKKPPVSNLVRGQTHTALASERCSEYALEAYMHITHHREHVGEGWLFLPGGRGEVKGDNI